LLAALHENVTDAELPMVDELFKQAVLLAGSDKVVIPGMETGTGVSLLPLHPASNRIADTTTIVKKCFVCIKTECYFFIILIVLFTVCAFIFTK
jgi:hypothetical protein